MAELHNVKMSGVADGQPIVFAHGFGCDMHMWRFVAPAFEDDFQVILFDHVGAGGARAEYDIDKYSTLRGYAEDVIGICDDLELRDVVFVGHSVSAMIGALASIERPDLFSKLVMVGPSPRYVNDGDYVGGFEAADVDEMLESLESNYLGWSNAMAPVIVGNLERPELGQELAESFCRMDPAIAAAFAKATFLGDNRADLARITVPTLVLQSRHDAIAPVEVGEYVRDAIPQSEYVLLDARGHCPNLSAPAATIAAIDPFIRAGS